MSDGIGGKLRNRLSQRTAILAAGALVLLLGGVFLAFSAICPCERTPGGWLFGSVQAEPVSDWRFANQVDLCQIQIRAPLLPHSINLNCFATSGGDLYLSCSNCDGKRWSGIAERNGWARLRLDSAVYPVTLTRIQDPAEMDRSWEARLEKLNSLEAPFNPPAPIGTPRPDHWWTFRVVSRNVS